MDFLLNGENFLELAISNFPAFNVEEHVPWDTGPWEVILSKLSD